MIDWLDAFLSGWMNQLPPSFDERFLFVAKNFQSVHCLCIDWLDHANPLAEERSTMKIWGCHQGQNQAEVPPGETCMSLKLFWKPQTSSQIAEFGQEISCFPCGNDKFGWSCLKIGTKNTHPFRRWFLAWPKNCKNVSISQMLHPLFDDTPTNAGIILVKNMKGDMSNIQTSQMATTNQWFFCGCD